MQSEFVEEVRIAGEVTDFGFDATGQMYGIVAGHLSLIDLGLGKIQPVDTTTLRGVISATHGEEYSVAPQQLYLDRLVTEEVYHGFVKVVNHGSFALEVSSATMPGGLQLANSLPISIGPGGSEVLSFDYQRSEAGSIDDVLTIRLNTADGIIEQQVGVTGLVYAEEPLAIGELFGYRDSRFSSITAEGVVTNLGTSDERLTALAVNSEGVPFGVSEHGVLYKLDVTHGDLIAVTQLFQNESISSRRLLGMGFLNDSTLIALEHATSWQGASRRFLMRYHLDEGSTEIISILWDAEDFSGDEGHLFSSMAYAGDMIYMSVDQKLFEWTKSSPDTGPREIGGFELPGMTLVNLLGSADRLYGIFKDTNDRHQLALINTEVGHALAVLDIPTMSLAMAAELPNRADGIYVTPERVDFRFIPAGNAVAVKGLAITNWSDDTQPLPMLPSLDSPFSWTLPKSNSIEPGQTVQIELSFEPDVPGDFSAAFNQPTGGRSIEFTGHAIRLTGIEEGFGVLTNTQFGSSGFVTFVYKVNSTDLTKELLGSFNIGGEVKDIEMDNQGYVHVQSSKEKTFFLDMEELTPYERIDLLLPDDLRFGSEIGPNGRGHYSIANQGESFVILEHLEGDTRQLRVSPGLGILTVKDFELLDRRTLLLLIHPKNQPVQWFSYDFDTGELTKKGNALEADELEDISGSLTAFDMPRVDAITPVEDPTRPTLMYPVPTSGTLWIETEEDIDQIAILDYVGREVPFELRSSDTGRFELSLEGVQRGLYMVRIRSSAGSQIVRRIIIR